MKSLYLTLFLATTTIFNLDAQISVYEHPAEILVNEVLSDGSISISNISYDGWYGALGYFDGNIINMPFQNGLLMTTGRIYDIEGPNDEPNSGVNNGSIASSNLLGPNTFYNTAKLEFDFVPLGDSLILEFIFGSDEYSEYVGSIFVDAFGVFLSGYGINGLDNIAKIPNGQFININTINNGNPTVSPPVPGSNQEYFVSNGMGSNAPYNSSNAYIQYDGFTKPIRIAAFVQSNQNYHLEIAIADAGDEVFDSGIFLKSHSLSTSTTVGLTDDLAAGLNISPNPANDLLNIESAFDNLTVHLLDLNGKQLCSKKITGLSGTVDLAPFQSGTYLVKICSSTNSVTKKVVKL